jgi:hypothetical protein
MWEILRKTSWLTTAALSMCLTTQAISQTATVNNNNQSFGFNLPHSQMPNGFDEVRTSDGTTCRSSMSGNGAYFDLGGITSRPSTTGESETAAYGRLVIPLGQRPNRIDCTSLYQLEIDRLRHELMLAKSGARGATGVAPSDWAKSGWNNNSSPN